MGRTEFKRGRTSIQDDKRPGRPKTVTCEETVAKIHNFVLNDRRLKVRKLVGVADISSDRLHYIVHEVLHMKKFSARWLPRLLSTLAH